MSKRTKLIELCVKNNWFTAGTNEQYEKLLDVCEKRANIGSLTAMIWICSVDVEPKEILDELYCNGF